VDDAITPAPPGPSERLRSRGQRARGSSRAIASRRPKEYVFDAEEGKKTLAELFDGRSQLLIGERI
jgi:predicted dithiol-disulfide oxidoreductase (DUF899 family)